jgi:hypothetical protein
MHATVSSLWRAAALGAATGSRATLGLGSLALSDRRGESPGRAVVQTIAAVSPAVRAASSGPASSSALGVRRSAERSSHGDQGTASFWQRQQRHPPLLSLSAPASCVGGGRSTGGQVGSAARWKTLSRWRSPVASFGPHWIRQTARSGAIARVISEGIVVTPGIPCQPRGATVATSRSNRRPSAKVRSDSLGHSAMRVCPFWYRPKRGARLSSWDGNTGPGSRDAGARCRACLSECWPR